MTDETFDPGRPEDAAARERSMTPEERAQFIVVDMALPLKMDDDEIKEAKHIIATALRAHAEQARKEEREAKDQAYSERNKLVALLARLFPSGVARTDIPGWDEEWHGCVYIDLPTGQASWHFHDSEAHLFDCLPPYEGEWDGHTTEQKYQRLIKLIEPDIRTRSDGGESDG